MIIHSRLREELRRKYDALLRSQSRSVMTDDPRKRVKKKYKPFLSRYPAESVRLVNLKSGTIACRSAEGCSSSGCYHENLRGSGAEPESTAATS